MALREAILLLLTVVPIVPAQVDGTLRLADGGVSRCGRVEVFYDGRWGTIRGDDGWNTFAGDVVCQQLGYTGAQSVFKNAYYGEGQDPTWLFNLTCLTDSSSILECTHNGWEIGTSNHSEDAGVCCDCPQIRRLSTLPIRLSCPKCSEGSTCNTFPDKSHPNSRDCRPQVAVRGIVEVLVNGEWGTISAEGWGVNEAKVVCGELGYPIVYPPNQQPPSIADIWPNYNSEEGSGTQCWPWNIDQTESLRGRLGHTFIQGVKCSGNEALLLHCTLPRVGKCLDTTPNMSHQVATVQCGYEAHTDCRHISTVTYRLRGGAMPWKGRVEVKNNGEWGTVCDIGFDAREGNIICRNLGYGTAKHIIYRAGYGRGYGKIHFSEIACTGFESKIETCRSKTGYEATRCTHAGDVAIECRVPEEPPHNYINKVQMWENPASLGYTYPEILGVIGWGLLCHTREPLIDRKVGQVICRQTRGEFLSTIRKSDLPLNYSGLYYHGSINCTGNEMAITECGVDLQPWAWCPTKYTLVLCSPYAPDLVPDLTRFKDSLKNQYYLSRMPMSYLTCAKEENCLSSSAYNVSVSDYNRHYRDLLRFDSRAWNLGTEDFRPVAPRDQWEFHLCHYHYHSMNEFVHYDLLNARTYEKVAEGHKASFCLEDTICIGRYRRYSCGIRQGIAYNCADSYPGNLDCQWIDVTGVPNGNYILQLELNPQHLVFESDYKNNKIACDITISNHPFYRERIVVPTNCWMSDH